MVGVLKGIALSSVVEDVRSMLEDMEKAPVAADGEINGDGEDGAGAGEGNGETGAETNGGDEQVADKEEMKRLTAAKLTQLMFDVLYFEQALGGAASRGDAGFEALLTPLGEGAGLDGAAVDRLRRSAVEYWKRTYLLFALLVG